MCSTVESRMQAGIISRVASQHRIGGWACDRRLRGSLHSSQPRGPSSDSVLLACVITCHYQGSTMLDWHCHRCLCQDSYQLSASTKFCDVIYLRSSKTWLLHVGESSMTVCSRQQQHELVSWIASHIPCRCAPCTMKPGFHEHEPGASKTQTKVLAERRV